MSKSFLEYIDIYREDIKLRINKDDTVKTKTGGLLTILTGLLLLLCCYLLGNDIIFRQNPTSYISNIKHPSGPKINLNKYNYPLSVYINDVSGNKLGNLSFLIPKLSYYNVTMKSDGTFNYNVTDIPLVQCKTEHFPSFENIVDIHPMLLNSLCIDNQNIFIEGYYNDKISNYLKFSVSACDYDLTPSKCATKQEIDDLISSKTAMITLMTIGHSVSMKDYKNPITKFVDMFYVYLFAGGFKNAVNFINLESLNTDSGFFSESFEEINYFNLIKTPADLSNSKPNKMLVAINLFSNSQQTVYYRSYIKVTSIFGSLGGILKLILLFFQFVNLPFHKIEKYLLLSERKSIYSFNNNNTIYNNTKSIHQSSSVSNNNNSSSNICVNNNFINNDTDKNKNKYTINQKFSYTINKKLKEQHLNKQEDLNSLGSKMKISFCLFKKFIGCKLKKEKEKTLYNTYINKQIETNRLLDASYILRQIQQVSKLKFIMLDSDSLEIFDNIIFKDKKNLSTDEKLKFDTFTK